MRKDKRNAKKEKSKIIILIIIIIAFILGFLISNATYECEEKNIIQIQNVIETKDTIHYVNVDDTCNGVKVRAKLLAAILRLADELSDDFNRSNYKGITIPPENEAYHEYSKSLTPVGINKETVSFHFRIPYNLTQRKIGK